MDNHQAIDASFQKVFEALYDDLRSAFPHPFDWMGLMERPSWHRFQARRAHAKVKGIFAAHGFVLTERDATTFRACPGQGALGFPEDAGGSIVRKLRQTFQGQTGVPYQAL